MKRQDLNEYIKIGSVPYFERKDIDSYRYMKVKNYIPAKEPIQVEIYIPNPIQKGRKEIQIIRRLLKL